MKSLMYLKTCLIAGILLVSGIIRSQDTIPLTNDSLKNNITSANEPVKQEEPSVKKDSLKHNIFLNAFTSLPSDDFKSTDPTNADAGYAMNGYGAELGYSYRIFKGLGLILNLGYSKNSIDEKKLADQIKEITIEQTGFTNIYSSAVPAFWEMFTVSGGLSYQFWFGSKKKIGVEPVLLFGESHIYTPDIAYNVRIDDLTFETRNRRKGSWVFMHEEGLNINYLLGSRTIIHLNARNYNASGSGKDMEHIVLGNKTYTRTLTEYNININSMLIGIGISTRF